jgi:paraquat-inducible protein B
LVMHASNAFSGLDRLVNTPELVALPALLNQAVGDAGDLIRQIEQDIGLLSADAREAITAAAAAVKRMEYMFTIEGGPTAELMKIATETLREARLSLKKMDEAVQAIQESAADERTYYQLQETLRNVGQAAESLRWLADYLGRHPEALLRGRSNPGGEIQ